MYNCAMFVDHTGRVCGKYHKLQLAEGHLQVATAAASLNWKQPGPPGSSVNLRSVYSGNQERVTVGTV